MIKCEILVPLLNANEPEARLAGIHVKDKQSIEKGMVLFTLETTKAAADVEAPESGFVRLLVTEGAMLAVGDKMAVITGTAKEPLEASAKGGQPSAPAGSLRITKPARALAEGLGIDLASLPTDRLVTEAVVRTIASPATLTAPVIADLDPKKSILIYGAGGHAKSIMDMVLQLKTFRIAGIVDDDDAIPVGTLVLGIPVLGTRAVLPKLVEHGLRLAANGVGGIINIQRRVKIYELMEGYGFSFPILTHPRATVETSATVGEGVQIFANAYVGSEAVLRPRCMVNTSAVVSHDCEVGAYSHIAPGALLAGEVHVGGRTLVGMGVTTAIGIRIGDGVRIGNGAIIYADVPDKTIIPAGKVWGDT